MFACLLQWKIEIKAIRTRFSFASQLGNTYFSLVKSGMHMVVSRDLIYLFYIITSHVPNYRQIMCLVVTCLQILNMVLHRKPHHNCIGHYQIAIVALSKTPTYVQFNSGTKDYNKNQKQGMFLL